MLGFMVGQIGHLCGLFVGINSAVSENHIRFWDIVKGGYICPMSMRNSLTQGARLQSLLREVRAEAGLRQADLAERLGQPQSFVSKYESGERRLDILELREVCKALGLPFEEFIERLEERLEMKPDPRFLKQPKSFWANVRTISQEVGYTETAEGYWKVPPGLTVPAAFRKNGGPRKNTVLACDLQMMKQAFENLGLKSDHVIGTSGHPTELGKLLCDYFHYRADVLNTHVQPNLMDAKSAKKLFEQCKKKYSPVLPFVMNKQKGNKRAESFLTCIVNMIVERQPKEYGFDADPHSLTTVTRGRQPLRTLARRLDGAFPSVVNPIAVWEIKEYYYTTTFGSRVADGVYETLMDGMEIEELQNTERIAIKHYLFADSHFTWWACGKSYLCRIVDMLHMGYSRRSSFRPGGATRTAAYRG